MRKQRTRRGLRRRVRRNKTMKGGMFGLGTLAKLANKATPDRLIPIKIETFRQTGYTFAMDSLNSYGITYDKIPSNATSIKSEYNTFYNKLSPDIRSIDNYEPNEIGSTTANMLTSFKNAVGRKGAFKSTGTRPLLKPDDFNDVLDKIVTKWIDNQKVGTTVYTNRQFIDFGLSYTKMKEATPGTNPGTNLSNMGATAVEGDLDKLKGAAGPAMGNMAGKLSGLGSLFGKK